MINSLSKPILKAMETISDPKNTELLIIGTHWWKRVGGVRYEITDTSFENEEQLRDWLNMLFEQSGSAERLDGLTWHARCGFESEATRARVHVVLPPVAKDITVTIAIQGKEPLSLNYLVDNQMLSGELAEFLILLTRARINYVIAGATGSGKTALLQALSSYIDDNERILLVEEVPEVYLTQPNVVALRSSSMRHEIDDIPLAKFLGGFMGYMEKLSENNNILSNAGVKTDTHNLGQLVEGYVTESSYHKGLLAASQYDFVGLGRIIEEAVQMRMDRVIVGETRGSEAVELFRAMSTGCRGSMTTLHADSAVEVVSQLITMAASHPQHFSPNYLSSLIANTLDVVVFLHLPVDGVQRIDEVLEIGHQGVREGTVQHQLLWKYDMNRGEFVRSGAPSDSLKERIASSGEIARI